MKGIKNMINDDFRKILNFQTVASKPIDPSIIKIREQGRLLQECKDYKIDYDRMEVYFNNKSTYFTYRILVCINVEYINEMTKIIYGLK